MDLKRKTKIAEALEASHSKGNERLTEALVEALENAQTDDVSLKVV